MPPKRLKPIGRTGRIETACGRGEWRYCDLIETYQNHKGPDNGSSENVLLSGSVGSGVVDVVSVDVVIDAIVVVDIVVIAIDIVVIDAIIVVDIVVIDAAIDAVVVVIVVDIVIDIDIVVVVVGTTIYSGMGTSPMMVAILYFFWSI